jgi:hypothetical protein
MNRRRIVSVAVDSYSLQSCPRRPGQHKIFISCGKFSSLERFRLQFARLTV